MNMKRLFAAALLALSSIAFGATLNPVQLLNPAGSTTGQAIVSTGPTTAPTWGNVPVTAVTGVLPVANGGTGFATFNTGDVLVGGTGGSLTTVNTNSSGLPLISSGTGFPPVFTPLTLAGGGTSATTAAQARTNLGAAATSAGLNQFAATTSAQLAGVVSDETGSGSLVFGTSPTITTPAIVGVTNASSAAAGNVGQVIPATGTAIALSNATPANLTSISLPAGDWWVFGSVAFAATGGTTPTVWTAGINTTSATLPGAVDLVQITATMPASAFASLAVPMVHVNVSATTTVFLVGQINGTTGTGTGKITAVRFSR
jgi:hypothetical protein